MKVRVPNQEPGKQRRKRIFITSITEEETELKPTSDRGVTIWLTGLSGAGKSTITQHLVPMLRQRGKKVEVLDGDVVRTNLSKGLGFSKEDRDTNIRRIGFVCNLLTRNGVVAIAAAISPYKAVRDENRQLIGDFVEVYVKASLEACIARDVKGLYKKALAGEIKAFTGVSDPYEPPEHPEVVCDTERETPQESAEKIVAYLEQAGYVPAAAEVEGALVEVG
ncbi:adenylyl-sulfate kinase [Candidatus Parcubacteria bacterium]|nr:MAG: adenylyl-sulfate kinase [Candidatus Parcubacteria bacterium]